MINFQFKYRKPILQFDVKTLRLFVEDRNKHIFLSFKFDLTVIVVCELLFF